MLWDLMAGTVRRCVDSVRMGALLQIIHQVQAVTFYIGHSSLSAVPPAFPPTSSTAMYPPPASYPPYPQMMAPHPPQLPPQSPFPTSPFLGFSNSPLPPHVRPNNSPPTSHNSPLLPPPSHNKPPLPAPLPLYPQPVKPESIHVQQEAVLHTPKLERKLELPFYSPPPEDLLLHHSSSLQPITGVKHPREEEDESSSPPPSVPLKKRKCNLYSEILQEAINSTLH